jgi:aphidicolan-16beta-ol synthase/syn-copalyl-diphosphate synthase
MALHKNGHDEQLRDQAVSLVKQAGRGYDSKYAHGSMSCATYDTAWVSLVTKSMNGGTRQWLFPESFRFLVDHQESDGSWGRQASAIDKILNTAAALLSLSRHVKEPLQLFDKFEGWDLEKRIERATQSLQHQLAEWDVASTTHVGFEIIVPALLDLLACEGIGFFFKAHDDLIKARAAKLKRFDPELLLYGKHKSTLLHSLEAFTGRIDYDKLAHHKVNGSLMASPSSTAAYLMNVSSWDDEAEDYLRHVINQGPGCGQGSVPSAYPSSNFEYSWVSNT